MSANIDAVLARLDEMNNGEINYEVYRELHDLVSAIEDDVQAPIELFPGTLEALDALSVRARTTSPDAATAEQILWELYPDDVMDHNRRATCHLFLEQLRTHGLLSEGAPSEEQIEKSD